METDNKFLKLAIENSQKSMDEGNFPAGAVVVRDGKVIASEVSPPYPGLLHADSKAVTSAFNSTGILTDATLYICFQPCLMCTGVAYWGGVRRIVYAIPKSEVLGEYYETAKDTTDLFNDFNQKIEFVHMPELQQEALTIVRNWEKIFAAKNEGNKI